MNDFIYDRSLRELFQDVPKTLIKLLVGKEIKEVLDISFPKVEERRVDLLTRLEDDTLFHLEIQSTNDKTMPIRMLQYSSLIYEKYQKFPKQLVLYVGDKKSTIQNEIKDTNICYTYEVKDIREFDCSTLIESDDLADNIIAVLCKIENVDKFFKKLNSRLLCLDHKKREDYLRKIFYLLRLRPKINDLYNQKYKKELPMPFVIEKESDPLFKDGLEIGLEQGLEQGAKNSKLEIAKELIKKGLSSQEIATITSLALEEVEKLREEH